MFNNILVVCVGNICRSPAAQNILRQQLPEKHIHSAGLGALVGHDIEENMAALLEQDGYEHNGHQARQINEQLVASADLILVMEQRHLSSIRSKFPTASGKTMLLGKWNGDEEVPDPYRRSQEIFEISYGLIAKHCQQWQDKLATPK
ncbi:low molecular weight protein-tyrosine-phosphatase [Thalassotalea sp. PS06]|uniref:low molecular weight protein-tyrosine-phosphatase n=1 Tax=Thalassotalea sp. PS06 TaxID=2594005 RepID=UPI001164D4C0|nr:low molecular weight protein-tyrosine-phosphatase [Thalassotalea sp. PS06]QDP01954.1 low molecular weight phosphotyrosine protein phosphatase [Thalassotalea sp. PS06]